MLTWPRTLHDGQNHHSKRSWTAEGGIPVSASSRRMPAQLHENLVNETPAPVLSGLERPHDRMPHGVRMQTRMPVGRGITAAHVATGETKAQMLPRRTDGQAFL